MNKKSSRGLRLAHSYQFGCALLALCLAGCASLPSRMWVARDSPLYSEEPPRDSFSFGERPVVFIQGFEGMREVVLQLTRNGKEFSEEKYPLHSGQRQTRYGQSYVDAVTPHGPVERRPETEVVNNGDSVLLGNLPSGNYEVALKTNGAVIATCAFKVVWPPDLENESQAIDSLRQKCAADSRRIQELQSEIEIEKTNVNQHDAAVVNAFNEKVGRYNELVRNYNSDNAELDAKTRAFNDRISAFGTSIH
jgi:hypothetical protein